MSENNGVGYLLTEAEVAEYLKVSIHTVRAWRYNGLLNYFSVGNRIRIESAEVERFLNARRRGGWAIENAVTPVSA